MLTNYVKIAIAAYGGTKAMHERKNSMRECMLLFYETTFAARALKALQPRLTRMAYPLSYTDCTKVNSCRGRYIQFSSVKATGVTPVRILERA